MRIAIVGGSAAGMFASLLLARAGHNVILLDRDRIAPAPDLDTAAAMAFRRAAPQIVQPHAVMARGRELLCERLPDVYHALLAVGAIKAPLATQMPATLSDRAARPGDERLTMLMTRRSTLDWLLRRAVAAQPGVTARGGVRVCGLRAAPGAPPRVTGLRTATGDVDADIVIDASGHRTPIDRWLEAIEAGRTETRRAACGLAYFSRHYRLRAGVMPPGPPATRILANFDEFAVGIWGGDNGTMQLVVVPLALDHRFRMLTRTQVFNAVVRTVPVFAAWLDALEPISGIYAMGAMTNTLRRLVVDGAPLVIGLHSVGDAVCTTNPTFGRGLTLALWMAADLADLIAAQGRDAVAQALAMDARVAEHVAPYYADQATIDGARLALLRHTIFGAPAPQPPPLVPHRVTFAQLRAAAQHDPVAFRAFWRVMGTIAPPDAVYTDPSVVAATRAVRSQEGSGAAIVQPARAQLLAALSS
jgi:2-polyprenyl-6-methoxyphenol hydroxylase-like FAD-dependent oxidoreductase